MEGSPKITQENIIEKSKIREGVDFVFEQNPELSQIGNKEQYSEYLNTIFPDSKVKDIVYHGTQAKKFDAFNENIISTNSGNYGYFGKGFYFSQGKRLCYGDTIIAALINIKNPYHFDMKGKLDDNNLDRYFGKMMEETYHQNKKGYQDYYDEFYHNNDGVIVHGYMGKSDYIHEISIFNANNIHILGSNKDLEKFKEFITNNQDSQS